MHMAKILGLIFAEVYRHFEPDINVSTVEVYDDILLVEVSVLTGTCVFLFRSLVKNIFIFGNVTKNTRNALIYPVIRAFILPTKTSPHV
jgi:hypothetical protein